MKLRNLILLTVCLSVLSLSAEKLTITRMTGGNTVNIGGRNLKVGNTFEESDPVAWSSDSQRIEAKNIKNGAIYRFSAKQFASKKGVSSVKDFFMRINKTSTRQVGAADYSFTAHDPSAKFPDKRIALLIGNTNYTEISSLRNPVYDVEAMSDALRALGFDVMEAYDCDYTDMTTALNSFTSKAKDYDVAFFYYSGHGLQEAGHNYLIPVNANLEYKSELTRCLDAYDVIDRMENSGVDTRIICLDACRDVKTSWTRSSAHGLTTMEGSPGTAIICSTRSGQVALDGAADNSPFASSMINAMADSGKSFSEMISNVVKQTYTATDKRQCPIVNGTLLSEFVFNPNGAQIKKIAAEVSEREIAPAPAPQISQVAQAAPSAESSYEGIKAMINKPRRSGSKLLVDIVITNKTSKAISGKFVGKEPCMGFDEYQIAAWDDLGNEYTFEGGNKIKLFKGTERMWNTDINLPPEVPVKYTLCIDDVPSSATALPLLTIAFRGIDPYQSYGQTLIRVRNLPLQ